MSTHSLFHHPALRAVHDALSSSSSSSSLHSKSHSSSLLDNRLTCTSSSPHNSSIAPMPIASNFISSSPSSSLSSEISTRHHHSSLNSLPFALPASSLASSSTSSSSSARVTVCPEIAELLESGLTLEKAMIAGAAAGVIEHVSMFPIDTIKTRMQVLLPEGSHQYTSISQTIGRIYREEGIFRLYRGVTAVVAAAIPSHAVHYATYELAKASLGANQAGHRPLETAVAGSIATMAHDAVVTPLDVIKQRLQMYNSQYHSVKTAAARILKEEGIRGFYAAYPTTVAMNIPFVSVYFTTYESMKLFLTHQKLHHTDSEGLKDHLLAGGVSGASAGFLSTPFDVVKTRIQTQHAVIADGIQQEVHVGTLGMFRRIWAQDGLRGFFKGASARMLYFTPSAAICWTAYETLKSALKDAW